MVISTSSWFDILSMLLYAECWLKADVCSPHSVIVLRTQRTPKWGVIFPLLSYRPRLDLINLCIIIHVHLTSGLKVVLFKQGQIVIGLTA